MGFLSTEPLRLDQLIAAVSAPPRGAIVTFLGLVRNHHGGRAVTGLDYSAYEPMAEALCRELIAEVESKWEVQAALSHRLGRLQVGDAAVAIAVGGGHRDEAFAACRHLIEELKRRVPIWKREYYADGTESWVDPTREQAPAGGEEREGPRPW
ncbi:MAG TPA: molybdenum cofactor biosynthesis protein MoaE [Gemmatimonadales bacterium]|nr:molybdenum cofactor biosynthesis protein MoaE [Gemmatimonadales bacterium]